MDHKGTVRLETNRLVLRRFEANDAQPMFDNWASDPAVTAFMTWPPHESQDVTRSVLDSWIADYPRDDFYQWAIVLRDLAQPVGSISVVSVDEAVESLEIGYCIGRRWWRQGVTSEALQAVIDYLFGEVGALRLCAKHDTRNPNSGRVMRHCGMAYAGTLRQAGRSMSDIGDLCVYDLLRKEWEDARA